MFNILYFFTFIHDFPLKLLFRTCLNLICIFRSVFVTDHIFLNNIQKFKGLQYSDLQSDKVNILNLKELEELETVISLYLNN